MEKYGITTPKKLAELCVANDWLAEMTFNQYTKIFDANEFGCCVHTITLLIWMCSPDADILRIKEALTLAHEEYKMSEGNNDD